MDDQIFYAVKYGRQLGICTTATEYMRRINGFQGAWGDAFSTREEAMNFLGVKNEKELHALEQEATHFLSFQEGAVVLYVDGSHYPQDDVYGGAFVAIKDSVKIAEGFEPGETRKSTKSCQSLAGELLGTLLGVRYAVRNRFNKAIVHYDNEDIALYGANHKEPKHEFIREWVNALNAIRQEHGLQIEFVKVKAHSGNPWNDYVDKLAKQAAQVAKRDRSNFTKKAKKPIAQKSKWERSHETLYELYRRGIPFEDLVLKKGLKDRKVAIELLKCGLEGNDIDANSYLSFPKKLPLNPHALRTYELYKEGRSLADIVNQTAYTENTVLKHLILCFSNFSDVDLNGFLAGNATCETVKPRKIS